MSNERNRPPIYGSRGITTMVWNEGVKSYEVRAPGSGYTDVPIVPFDQPEPEASDQMPQQMDEKRANVADLLKVAYTICHQVEREWLLNLLTSAYGPERANEYIKDFRPVREVTDKDIEGIMKIVEPETPDPDQSTWRTRPGLL
jgi:hypothetical protein